MNESRKIFPGEISGVRNSTKKNHTDDKNLNSITI